MNKSLLIENLEQFALLLELDGANPFKIRAYTNAIRSLEGLDQELAPLIEAGILDQIKGIGKGLANHISQIWRGETDPEAEALRARIPAGLLEILQIPGLGPKKVRAIYEQLGISSLGELEYACQENRLVSMKGFGAKTQTSVLKGLELLKSRQGQFLYPFAQKEAEKWRLIWETDPRIQEVSLTADMRRHREVVTTIEWIASCETLQTESIMHDFVSHESVSEVLTHTQSHSRVRLNSGLLVDLHLVSVALFPYRLLQTTGSPAFFQALQAQAQTKGFVLNGEGLFLGEQQVPCADEHAIFAALGLPWIAPEIREGTEWLTCKTTPHLIEESDIKGVFHAHSTWSDGAHTLAEMVSACRAKGWQYLGITEHSQSAVYAHGLEIERVHAQWAEIDALNAEMDDFHIFKGIEVDILPDGQLDYDDDLLAGFDFVIASVHSRFKMSESEMTARLLRAAAHPAVTLLGHLTGRILLAREGYPVDIEQVIENCVQHQTLIELNAHPSRLDLDWRYGALARAKGLKTAINPDAHSIEGLNDVRFGIGAARKAGFGPQNVLNTLSLSEMREYLNQRKQRA